MSHVIIRGANRRRHEVDFGEDELRVVLYPGGETVELLIEADVDELPEGRRRFALINIPLHLLTKALAGSAKNRTIREA
jgi:hypothetical protein